MISGTGTQVFIPKKSPAGGILLWAVLHLILGFVAWFVLTTILMSIVERVVGPVGEVGLADVIVVLFLLSGTIVVPLCVFLRWYVATTLAIALDAETGITLTNKSMRRGEQIKHYHWQDVTGTQMIGTTSGEGIHTEYTFYVYTADGGEIKIPRSMGSFDYFLDIVNRATTHLTYTWMYVDYTIAGRDQGWHQVTRAQG
ncbi:MAG TPA: hypothetical protein VF240_16710 [Pyrinomonadaceae bacterium]